MDPLSQEAIGAVPIIRGNDKPAENPPYVSQHPELFGVLFRETAVVMQELARFVDVDSAGYPGSKSDSVRSPFEAPRGAFGRSVLCCCRFGSGQNVGFRRSCAWRFLVVAYSPIAKSRDWTK